MSSPVHFGKYLLIDKIGTGGMAELFMAKQTGLKGFEKVMAIKRILPQLTKDAEFISMFINEAKLAALLSHQNIVQIFDLGHVENSFFIAMEYVMGKDLRTILHRSKALNLPMSVGHSLLIISKVCAGLDYAHRKRDLSGRDLNIVHRDISPQNILVSYEGEVKVVDFGIAKAASQSAETRTGILKGKLSYMAPEQARGKPVDRRTDIFAIGIVLYEMLTGHKLFKGDNEFDTLEKVREARVEPMPSVLNKHVSPELEAIVLKALAKNPEDRYPSASELQTALEDHMAQKGYDFSTARLAQYLQSLFQYDIEQDTQRFMTLSGAYSTVGVGIADQSTLIRGPRPHGETTPSQPSRRFRIATSRSRSARAVRRESSAFAIMILTVIFLMGASIWVSMINPPFLQALSQSYPRIQTATVRLGDWPEQAMLWIHGMIQPAALQSESPARVFLHPPPVPSPSEIQASESPSGSDAIDPNLDLGSSLQKTAIVSHEIEERSERQLTPQEKEEIRRLLEEAKAAYDERRLDDVERMLRRLIDLNPKIPTTYHLLGAVTLERKDPDGALRIFEEATRKFPSYSLLHYDLGFLYFKQGVTSLAQDELEKGLSLNPDGLMADRARLILGEMKGMPVNAPPVQSESADSIP